MGAPLHLAGPGRGDRPDAAHTRRRPPRRLCGNAPALILGNGMQGRPKMISPPCGGDVGESRQRGVSAKQSARGACIHRPTAQVGPLCPAGHLPHKGEIEFRLHLGRGPNEKGRASPPGLCHSHLRPTLLDHRQKFAHRLLGVTVEHPGCSPCRTTGSRCRNSRCPDRAWRRRPAWPSTPEAPACRRSASSGLPRPPD